MGVTEISSLKAQHASLHKYGRTEEAKIVRTKLACAVEESRIADLMAMTPPPSPDDRARLQALLDCEDP